MPTPVVPFQLPGFAVDSVRTVDVTLFGLFGTSRGKQMFFRRALGHQEAML